MSLIVFGVIGVSLIASVVVIVPAIKLALDLAPFLYANTRCSARSSLILNRKIYEELLSSSSLKETFALLENSGYSQIVEHAKDFKSLSIMLDKEQFKTYDWMKSFVPKELIPVITAIQMKYEINEIKQILNNLKMGREIKEIHFINDPDFKIKLQGVKDFQAFTAVCEGTPYQAVFAQEKFENLEKANTCIDKYYYGSVYNLLVRLNSKAAEPFKEYWQTQIDLVNLRLVLRKINSKSEDITLLEGGSVNIKDLLGIADYAQLETVLEKARFKEFIDEIKDINIELGIYKYLKKQSSLIDTKFNLKAGPIVRFIILKELEQRNMNIIIKLKQENFKEEEIQKLVVI